MITIILSCLLALAVVGLMVAGYFITKFLKYIMWFEDYYESVLEDYDKSVETLLEVEARMDKILSMPIFFDNAEIRFVVEQGRDEARFSRIIIRRMAEHLVRQLKAEKISYEELLQTTDNAGDDAPAKTYSINGELVAEPSVYMDYENDGGEDPNDPMVKYRPGPPFKQVAARAFDTSVIRRQHMR